eukprot:Nitzschia sp. Nitz4//scaffold144_size56818//594//1799//NITZ4_006524-RA/size56818-processed-gene-0.61-mRNA-1//1//CDS//3329536477//6575//frame0
MERRKNNGAVADEEVPNGIEAGSSASVRSGIRNLKSLFIFAGLAGLYYYVGIQEKDSILTSISAASNSSLTITSTPQVTQARLDDNAEKEFFLKPQSEFTPAIVWLMSFPNSGTSYTMTMVARSSGKAFASNYGDEVTAEDDEESLSIYPRRPEGPFWAGLSGKIATPRPLPDDYVITKTHCGSRCIKCGPDEYVESAKDFLRHCASGHARIPPKRRRVDVKYNPDWVAKAIHLIRNPFHNIIARYHLEHRHAAVKNQTGWLDDHANDADGLQKYCADADDRYHKEDKEFFGKDKIPKAPCHGEFYKWTQWHNLVFESLELIDHEVPILTVYYEDYNNKFNATVGKILDFLELKQDGVLREFTSRSDYGGYFTDKQQKDVRSLVKKVASERTWATVKHYFD